MRQVYQLHQPPGNSIDIPIEPALSDNLKKEVDEDRIHTNNGKKEQIFAVVLDINIPVTCS